LGKELAVAVTEGTAQRAVSCVEVVMQWRTESAPVVARMYVVRAYCFSVSGCGRRAEEGCGGLRGSDEERFMLI
jgi:hypothetical protein